jgi:D-3-phosphoglycerate dehydrogenase / 2-oxoglutarate reductase
MSRIRILNAEPDRYSAEARTILREAGELREEALDRVALLRAIPGFHVLITRLGLRIDRDVLDAGERLMAVVTATTGLDHVDVDHAATRGIAVLSLRGETEFLWSIPATAEHTWALLLALVRRIPAAAASVNVGMWNRDRFRGSELRGKTLGLVGVGRIGRQVARYGLAFGMDVQGYDPDPGELVEGVRYAPSLEQVLAGSDVVSVHVPLTPATRHLIGGAELRRVRPGAILVNTARGDIIDSTALLSALQDGRLGAAALDVVEDELWATAGRRDPLIEYARRSDRLLITPHIGGATEESMARTEVFMARKLVRFLEGDAGRPRS